MLIGSKVGAGLVGNDAPSWRLEERRCSVQAYKERSADAKITDDDDPSMRTEAVRIKVST